MIESFLKAHPAQLNSINYFVKYKKNRLLSIYIIYNIHYISHYINYTLGNLGFNWVSQELRCLKNNNNNIFIKIKNNFVVPYFLFRSHENKYSDIPGCKVVTIRFT